MALKIADLLVNTDDIDNGAWIGNIPELPGVRFKVRGSEYEPYKKALASYHASSDVLKSRRGRLAQMQQNQDFDADKWAAFVCVQTATHLLLDWDGLDVPMTPELAMTAMTDRAWINLRAGIRFAVEVVDAGVVEHREEAAGN